MFKFEMGIAGVRWEYKVTFQHTREVLVRITAAKPERKTAQAFSDASFIQWNFKKPPHGATACRITRLANDHLPEELISAAVSYCGPHDVFDKNEGRFKSFMRALDSLWMGDPDFDANAARAFIAAEKPHRIRKENLALLLRKFIGKDERGQFWLAHFTGRIAHTPKNIMTAVIESCAGK